MAFIKTIGVFNVSNIFDFLLYHVALQTTVFEVQRLANEHRRMKDNFGDQCYYFQNNQEINVQSEQ